MSKVFDFLPRAERLARDEWRKMGGERRGVDFDEVKSEVYETLCKLALKYDERRATVIALLDVAIPRTVRSVFAKHKRHEAQPLDGVAFKLTAHAAQDNVPALRKVAAWVGQDDERRGVLETIERGQRLNRRQRELAAQLRERLGCAAPAQKRRVMAASAAGQLLRQPVRRVRELCESGELPAERAPDNTWNVKRRDVLRLRHKRIAGALAAGSSYRTAAEAAHVPQLRTVHRVARRSGLQRPRGRPAVHDHAEILAALTDQTRAPHTWRNGYPVLRAVARHVGCSQMEVQRQYRKLTKKVADDR